LRVSSSHWFDQQLKIGRQRRVAIDHTLSAGSGPADTKWLRRIFLPLHFFKFFQSGMDSATRYPGAFSNRRYASMTQNFSLGCGDQASQSFIKGPLDQIVVSAKRTTSSQRAAGMQ
jgi:hypothetical protein